MIWGVNFASNSTSNAVAQAQAIVATFASGGAADSSGVILDSIEIGSAADLYRYTGRRGPSYNTTQYAEQWVVYDLAVVPPKSLLIQVAGVGSGHY